MMETNAKFLKLLEEVRDATREDQAAWEESLDDNTFRITKPYGMLEVRREMNSFPSAGITYTAALIDDRGRVIEALMTVDGPKTSNGPGFLHVDLLRELYEAAERHIHRSDVVLDLMLADFAGKGRASTSTPVARR